MTFTAKKSFLMFEEGKEYNLYSDDYNHAIVIREDGGSNNYIFQMGFKVKFSDDLSMMQSIDNAIENAINDLKTIGII